MHRVALLLIMLGTVATGSVACSSGKSKNKLEPTPNVAAAPASIPEIACEAMLPPDLQARLLPGREVTHTRSCADGICFADTCTYRRDVRDRGVQVLYDCRGDADGSAIRSRNYFSTGRKNARLLSGVGAQAAVDDEGLTFFDGETSCLVTIRSEGDEQDYVELARTIESNLR